MIAMQYSLNQDEWVSTALSSMIDDDQLGANLKSATSSCEVNSFSSLDTYSIESFIIKRMKAIQINEKFKSKFEVS